MLVIYKVMMKKRMTSLIRIIGVLFFCVGSLAYPAMAQKTNATVKGIVKDATTNESLPGVNVLVKGTTIGTATDMNGKYQLSVPSLADTLVFSYIGYKSKEVAINGETNLDVNLAPQAITGKQLVVIGYGSIKQSDVSGAISKINNTNLAQIPVSQASKALIGKIPGLHIQNTDAQAGATPNIVLRGVSSVSTSSSPLVVVDGYPVNGGLSSVDMSNVASISVLKDAASAAIYGSRASNGVIIITTKKGKAGKTNFNASYSIGFKQPYPSKPIYPSPQQWANFVTSDAKKSGLSVPAQIPTMLSLGTYTNWENLVLRNSHIQNFHISASGGNKSVNYYLGGGYQQNEGIIITNHFNKFDLNANLDAKVNDWLKMGGTIFGSYSDQRVAAVGFHDAIRTSGWLPITLNATTAKYANAAGYDVLSGDYAAERYFTNVNGVDLKLSSDNNGYVKLIGRFRDYYKYNTTAHLYAEIGFTKHLNFKTTAGAYITNNRNEYYQSSWSYRKGIASGYFDPSQDINWINENTLTYQNSWGPNDVTGLAGFSLQSDYNESGAITGNGFLTDKIHTLNAASNITEGSTTAYKSALVSTFYRLNYSYANKYILGLSIRWDGSSRFGSRNRWGSFPAVSAAWRIDQEKFLKRSKWISTLKLRASYGATGNNNIGDYRALAIVSPGYNAVFGSNSTVVGGFSTTNIANPALGWEKTYSLDAGLDFGVLDDRITMSVDLYNKKTHQMLLQKEIPAVTGFTSTWSNFGKVQNKGYEFEIKSHNITSHNFNWTLSANFYANRNKLLDFGGPTQLISTPDPKRPNQFIAEVGSPIDQFYGYVVDRSKGDNGQVPRNQLSSPYWPINVASAYVYVKDINHDGVINSKDRVPLGSPYPKFNWSVTNDFRYKNFDLSFMFTGSEGAKVYNIDSYYYNSAWRGSYLSSVKDPQFLEQKILTNWNVQDASFMALRTATIGYSLPHRIARKMQLNNLRVYFTGYNLLYLMAKGYTGLNPEGVNIYNTPLTYGYQRGAMPIVRSFNFGFDIQF